MPKGKAPMPLKGPIKEGTGKAMIAEAGGGRKALKTWRSLSKDVRKGYKAKAAAGTASVGILDAMKRVRSTRASRGGVNVTTNAAKRTVEQRPKASAERGAAMTERAKKMGTPTYAPQANRDRKLAKAMTARAKKMGMI